MELIHVSDLWTDVPARWANQYIGAYREDREKHEITKKLAALAPDELTGERIEAIIGNTLWTRQKCANCFKEKDTLCRLGNGDECDTVDVCLSCLRDAVALFEAA